MNQMKLPPARIKKILYATDLSENARYAFAYANSLASQYKAGLTILHVLNTEAPIQNLDTLVSAYDSPEVWREIKDRNQESPGKRLSGKNGRMFPCTKPWIPSVENLAKK